MRVPKHVGLGLHAPTEPTGEVERARWAEQQGFHSVWLTDGGGKLDALTLAAAVATQTSRVRICTGIVPVYTRPPAVFATTALALSHLAPGRFVLGLGASSHAMIEGWYGTPFVKPRTRVKETVLLVRRMLAGEKIESFQGETLSTRGFKLATAPSGPVPIYMAALRPRMLELAGEIADGVVLNLVPVEALPRVLEHIDVGAMRSGRRVEDLEIAMLLNTYVTRQPEKTLAQMRQVAVNYFSTPVYNKFLEWSGRPREAERIREGFREKDREKTMGALDDTFVDSLCALGSAERCRERVRAFHKAGLTTPIIVAATSDHDEYLATIEAFTPAAMASGA
ncbi:MAG: LLM class flavin-dependent oxidoreductase [Candidatus Lambdaproteobacteria bacterium]|nr:LLM class flavin-dependent oxidoreductase [Candidatus Lambdaproteobacteria bacterium]